MSCGCLAFAPDDPVCAVLGLGAAAQRYAGMGYAVLPLAAGGKKPHPMLAGTDGVHQATLDTQQLSRWWKQDPAANIGVATGMRSGLAVVDVDVKHEDGRSSLGQFLTGHGLPMPYDVAVLTPSGGWHIWLQATRVVPTRLGILPGVDLKGEGGYVVAPPSMLITAIRPGTAEHPGSGGEVPIPYELVQGCPHDTPAVPWWMYDWAHTAPTLGRPGSASGGEDHGDVVPVLELNEVGKGRRNDEWYRTACSLYASHPATADGEATVLALLREQWQAPGTDRRSFGWSEVLTLAESARKFVRADRAGAAEIARKHIAGEW